MNIIEKIKSWFAPEPERAFEYGDDDKENQIQDLHIYEDDELKKTIKLHYFTREQFDEIQGVADEVYNEWDDEL